VIQESSFKYNDRSVDPPRRAGYTGWNPEEIFKCLRITCARMQAFASPRCGNKALQTISQCWQAFLFVARPLTLSGSRDAVITVSNITPCVVTILSEMKFSLAGISRDAL
jgi:hypothetical protein